MVKFCNTYKVMMTDYNQVLAISRKRISTRIYLFYQKNVEEEELS